MPLQTQTTDSKKTSSPERAHESVTIDRPGRIVIVGRHLSTKTSLRCLIRKISLYGAELEVSPYISFPKNFFLEILGIRDEIGCTMISREEEVVMVGFNMLLNPEFLHHVMRLEFETNH